MGDIVHIESHMQHTISEVICINCSHRWIAVRPSVTPMKDMRCPACEETGWVIETGQFITDERLK